MKPWFEKESNVIPFPKPKAKVIQMPNVASYPDFLTGVKDLHNRKERGEISQDSHDKLYQDLIHRFMKKESFENPWFLRENKLVNASNKGTYLETLLGAALTARFRAGKEIGAGDVREVMKNLDQTLVSEYNIKRKGITDTLVFATKIKISPEKLSSSVKDILDPENLDIMEKFVIQTARVANTEKIVKVIEQTVLNNKKPDTLYVEAVGAEAQKTTKIDVGIRSKDSQGNDVKYPSVSLKKAETDKEKIVLHNTELKSVDQIVNLFEELLGININDAPIKRKMAVTKQEAFEPMPIIFNYAAKVLQKQLAGDVKQKEKVFLNNFKNFVDLAMRRRDDKVLLVVVTASDFSVLDFNNFAKNLDRFNLSVASPEGGRPRIVFTAKDNSTGKVYNLIELRYTFMQSHGRHRLFIEAYPAFKMLSKDNMDNQ